MTDTQEYPKIVMDLMTLHNMHTALEHMQKHMECISQCLDSVVSGNSEAADKVEALRQAVLSFKIIEADTRRALLGVEEFPVMTGESGPTRAMTPQGILYSFFVEHDVIFCTWLMDTYKVDARKARAIMQNLLQGLCLSDQDTALQ